LDYIEGHLKEELNLEQIAEHAGYSRFHLNRMIMEETGCTIYKYVQERRLTLAAEKLVDTDMDIAQISYDAG
ncbi:AraC family transcriptional regulator, partial [Eggerthella lenta]|nr:AraC family transcriptional regulator [Eggerthella lenta]